MAKKPTLSDGSMLMLQKKGSALRLKLRAYANLHGVSDDLKQHYKKIMQGIGVGVQAPHQLIQKVTESTNHLKTDLRDIRAKMRTADDEEYETLYQRQEQMKEIVREVGQITQFVAAQLPDTDDDEPTGVDSDEPVEPKEAPAALNNVSGGTPEAE